MRRRDHWRASGPNGHPAPPARRSMPVPGRCHNTATVTANNAPAGHGHDHRPAASARIPRRLRRPTFWGSPKGQALIGSLGAGTSTSLSSWLVSNFPNLYGSAAGPHNLVGVTVSQFTQPGPAGVLGKFGGPDQAVLAAAISVYATSQNLSGINLHSLTATSIPPRSVRVKTSTTSAPTVLPSAWRTTPRATVLTLLLDLNANTGSGAHLAQGAGPIFTGIDNTGNVINVDAERPRAGVHPGPGPHRLRHQQPDPRRHRPDDRHRRCLRQPGHLPVAGRLRHPVRR